MRLKEILSADSIELHSDVGDQLDAIGRLVELQEKNGGLTEKRIYRSAVYAREDITSTALDEGIAIPHAKSPAITKTCVSFMTLKHGVEWGAYDHSLSDLLFLIGAPIQGNEHLRLLTYITTLLTEVEALPQNLRAANSPLDVLDLLSAAEDACKADLRKVGFTQED